MHTQNVKTAATESSERWVENTQQVPFNGATDVIPSIAIDRILAQRAEGLMKYEQALRLFQEARLQLKTAAGADHLYGVEKCVSDALLHEGNTDENATAIRRLVDTKIWDRLMTQTGMYTFMSSRLRDEWDRQLHGKDTPEITLDNVLATFRELNARKGETFETGVIDMFRSLSWDYKTNNPCRIGKKIIIEFFLEKWGAGYVSLTQSGQQKLDDLARPFYMLDNKNVPDYRISEGAQFSEFYNKKGDASEIFEGEYFSVKWYKKGSAHIIFKRLELVDRLNDIVAKHYSGMLPARV
ncbi:DUF4942 domain-containing protein [Acerihabitans sp. TG2]|uniref:DUF4942 domain-containing protein n=1 Tax=Acerihabitans sp. TG2 TaxID=3096008 RepID=UPI002B23A407|nr:DUF4942 domain-containing protein [Acerihabitans sp. TG2]MEA9392680.1 DUF4942 domain-containing protein [Acerihabitans sp. TG2]